MVPVEAVSYQPARGRVFAALSLRHLQGALDRFGVTGDYAQERTGRLIRLVAPLFPVSYRRQRELKRSSEFALS